MTIGADADYFLPSEEEPRNFLELSDELLEMVAMAHRQIAETHDARAIREAINAVNDVFTQENLLGRTARLHSDSFAVTTRQLHHEGSGLVPVRNPKALLGGMQQGVFLGCDRVSLKDGSSKLAYLIELPLITEGLVFRTVMAPVDAAKLSIELHTPNAMQSAPYELWGSLELLNTIDNPIAQRNVQLMADLMESADETNADFLKEMSLLATEMLAQPVIAENMLARQAIIKILASCVDEDAWYNFEGLDFEVVIEGTGRHITIDEIQAVGQIHATATTSDFDYTYAQDGRDADVTLKKTLQPAYVFLDDQKVQHVVPLRYLTTFTIEAYPLREATCESSRERFLEDFPNIFREKKRYTAASYIVKKYFK